MGRIHAIDYLRGLASLAVAWFHLTNTYPQDGWIRHSGAYGWLGVDVFFVISGFVIPYSISRIFTDYSVRDFPSFMMRRMIRIEIPYIVSIVLVIGLAYLSAMAPGFRGHPPDYALPQVVSHLFYITPIIGEHWIQPVYWTLAYEFVFYISMGLLFPLIVKYADAMLWVVILLLAALTFSDFLNGRVWLFFLGGLTYSLMFPPAKRLTRKRLGGMFLVALAFMTMRSQPVWVVVGVIVSILIVLTRDKKMPEPIGKILIWFGGISYSLYLVHVPIGGRVVNLGRRFATDEYQMLFVSLLALGLSILSAWLFCLYVERPAMKLARHWARRVTGKAFSSI